MNKLACTACGANEFFTERGYRICKYCNTMYELPAQSASHSAKESVNSTISIKSDVELLLEKCRQNPRNARRYANLILDIDPTNKEAKRYL